MAEKGEGSFGTLKFARRHTMMFSRASVVAALTSQDWPICLSPCLLFFELPLPCGARRMATM
jgi:hypothetical protein